MAGDSYVHGASNVPLRGETIGALFDGIAREHPDSEALVSVHQRRRFTYRELHQEVESFARGLMAIGVDKGDRVGIWSPNNVEWMIAQYAIAKIGAILVNVNPAYRTHELGYVLRQSGISVLIAARKFRATSYVDLLRQVVPGLETARPGAIAADSAPLLKVIIYIGDERGPGGWCWRDVCNRARETPDERLRKREALLGCDDPINIQYTSGTTGLPKGVTLSHHNILNNGFFIGERLHLTSADRVCLPVPFYHCFGMVLGNLASLTHGATVVLPAESFDAEQCLRAIQQERCTAFYGVPTMFIGALQHPSFAQYDLRSLRTGIMAGSPCPVEVMRQVIELMHMRDVTICYGMTETSPVSFQSLPDDDVERRVSTVGAIHPHVESKIVDPQTGRTVPRGVPGELCSRGYLVMLGYWDDADATARSIDAARWMHTGDLAIMRDDGYVNIVGRIKDMIIRGGENVYPREIEEFLYQHPKVMDVQVVGVPDVKYGEESCAWVRLKDGEQATEEEIRAYCHGRIATYKIPRYIRFTTEFPMTVTGKIQKYRMREMSVAELGLEAAEAVRTA